jgi:hypothetical protein
MALMDDMLSRLQARIPADTQYPFTPDDLQQFLRDAVNQHSPDLSVESLPESEEYLVVWLALITVYTTLAARYAEDFDIKAGGGEFKMEQPHVHYMNLANTLLKQYKEAAGSTTIQISTATRIDTRTGFRTGLYPGDLQ